MRQWVRGAVGLTFLSVAAAAQEPTLPVPPNVIAQGVPPIPMSVVEAVSPYGQFRRARLVAWHPTERRMLIATAFGNPTQIHEIRFPGGDRRQLTFFRDGLTQRPAAAFEPAGRSFVFQRDTAGGGEATQLFRYDLASAAQTLLTDGKSRNGAPVVAPRSGLVAYESTRRNGKDRDLYVVDPADPKTARMVAQVDGAWAPLDWSPDERTLLAIEAVSSSETYLWRVGVADGQKTAVTERGGRPVRWGAAQLGTEGKTIAAFGPDGKTIYAVGNRESEVFRLWRRDDGGNWTALTDADNTLEDFALSPDGRTIAVVFDRGGESQLQLLDASGRPRRTPSLPHGQISDLVWHPAGKDIGFSLTSGRSFHDVYSVDVATGKAERWTVSETGGANPESLPDPEPVRWKSFDGLGISGWLYRPPARFTGARPVIINVHGGPVDRERPRALGRSNYFRNEMGIAIIYPNIRGSAGFGRSFEELDNGRLRLNAIKDIGALLDWIATQPSLDRNRVMIVGASYGGWVALASAIEYGDRIRCVQAGFAISDYPSYLESTDLTRQANRNAEYGDPTDPEMRKFLTQISPLTHAARLRTPLFLVHGAKDTRIPPAQAEMMAKAVRKNGTPFWYVVFQDAGHMTPSPPNADFNQFAWVVFVQKYLLN